MEKLVPIVEQLEEVKRFIRMGDVSHLRLALLLLDNASEILIYRAVTEQLARHDLASRIFLKTQDVMPSKELEALRIHLGYEPLSSRDRRALLRGYDAKIDFLLALRRGRRLSVPIGTVLKATHRYRNEAYHRDRIRKGTIQPVVTVLYDIVTDLMLLLSPESMSYCSSDDWTEFCTRYGFGHPFDALRDGIPTIVKMLKEDMQPETRSIAAGLADHILSRVDEMEHALGFLANDSGAGFSPDEELRRVQFWAEHDYVPQARDDPGFSNYAAAISLKDFARWRARANLMREETDRLELFVRFTQLEEELEPVEGRIHEAANLLTEAIEFAAEVARGK